MSDCRDVETSGTITHLPKLKWVDKGSETGTSFGFYPEETCADVGVHGRNDSNTETGVGRPDQRQPPSTILVSPLDNSSKGTQFDRLRLVFSALLFTGHPWVDPTTSS